MFFPEFNLDPLQSKDANDATGSSTTRNQIVMGFNTVTLPSSAKLVELRVIRYEGPLPNCVWTCNNFQILDNNNVFTPHMFNALATQPNGGGWMNEGHQRYVEGEGHDRYFYCAMMQSYVNDVTRKQTRTSDELRRHWSSFFPKVVISSVK